jgi:hypothetical protein
VMMAVMTHTYSLCGIDCVVLSLTTHYNIWKNRQTL